MRNYCNNPTFDSTQLLATMCMWVRRFGYGVPIPSSCCSCSSCCCKHCRACGPKYSRCSNGCSTSWCSCCGRFLEACLGPSRGSCLDPAWFSRMARKVGGTSSPPCKPKC